MGIHPINNKQYVEGISLTWVIKWHKYVVRRFVLCSLFVVNDFIDDFTSFSYVIAHTASGVNHKAHNRGTGNPNQSAKENNSKGQLDQYEHLSQTAESVFFIRYRRNAMCPTASRISCRSSWVAIIARFTARLWSAMLSGRRSSLLMPPRGTAVLVMSSAPP